MYQHKNSLYRQDCGGRIVKIKGGAGSYAPSARFLIASASAIALGVVLLG